MPRTTDAGFLIGSSADPITENDIVGEPLVEVLHDFIATTKTNVHSS